MQPMTEGQSDLALAAALAAGDDEAAREVGGWVRLAASPFRFRLGDDWEDAVHGCLVELLAALSDHGYTGGGSMRGYVWRLTVRSCIDRLRSRRRWRWEELDPERGVEASALSDLLDRERRARLLAVLAELPEGCRRLWRMILSGCSYREMSERVGAGEGALRVRVLRCRRRAQQVVERMSAAGNSGASRTPKESEGPTLGS